MSKPVIDAYGNTQWINSKGQFHRLDGPAWEGADGYKEWRVDGLLHRLDGPAIEYWDGSKEWWVKGKLHRLDGPAIEGPEVDTEWWVDSVNVTEQDYPQAVLLYKCKQVLES